jgi:2-amino-4-hydroxy-6-hydroxymethyldihydropteridine diphosphokinase
MISAVSLSAPQEVIIGAGANLGDPLLQLVSAVRELARSLEVKRVSSVYLTSPVGLRNQPDFHNLVLVGDTVQTPAEVHAELIRIETAAGRRRGPRNGPRHLDLDLLAYAACVDQSPALTLPHPRLHQRRFVLEPLVEVAPRWIHPVFGLSSGTLLERLDTSERVVRVGALADLAGGFESAG